MKKDSFLLLISVALQLLGILLIRLEWMNFDQISFWCLFPSVLILGGVIRNNVKKNKNEKN